MEPQMNEKASDATVISVEIGRGTTNHISESIAISQKNMLIFSGNNRGEIL